MRRSGWLILFVVVIVGVGVAGTMAYRGRQAGARAEARRARVAAMRSTPAPPVAAEVMARREALLAELHPVTLANCELARVGRDTDGGYLMCRNLIGALETAYSYGVGTEDAWACQMSRTYNVPVHQYDCFSPVRVRCWRGDLRLNAECVGPKTETIEGRPFDTIANQIAKNGDTGRRMVVKIDIEGAEWKTVLGTPDEVLAGIDQLPMELHAGDDRAVLDALQKLKKHFHLVSVHFNNQACTNAASPLPSWVFQVLFVNKRLGVAGPPPAGSPTAASLLAPDDPSLPDCQLPSLVPTAAPTGR